MIRSSLFFIDSPLPRKASAAAAAVTETARRVESAESLAAIAAIATSERLSGVVQCRRCHASTPANPRAQMVASLLTRLRREQLDVSPGEILQELDQYDLQGFSHTNEGLTSHLKGTFEILRSWGCSETLCVAGLCHSIYGTESYRQNPIDLSERENIRRVIGVEAEQRVYLFGAHVKDSLWENLYRDERFSIVDRLVETRIELSHEQLKDLITLTLANWLEQRPRAAEEYHFLRQDEFLRSERYLPQVAFEEFKATYGLQ